MATNGTRKSHVVMTRTQSSHVSKTGAVSRGALSGVDKTAEFNISRPTRTIARSQAALKTRAGKKGCSLYLPLFTAHLCSCLK